MAATYKVLGQVQPSAQTLSTLYTVPSATEAVASSLIIANLGGFPTTYRVAVRPDGATIENKHYVAYDISIGSLDSVALTLGVTINASDVVSVYSDSGLVTFNLFGSEIA